MIGLTAQLLWESGKMWIRKDVFLLQKSMKLDLLRKIFCLRHEISVRATMKGGGFFWNACCRFFFLQILKQIQIYFTTIKEDNAQFISDFFGWIPCLDLT